MIDKILQIFPFFSVNFMMEQISKYHTLFLVPTLIIQIHVGFLDECCNFHIIFLIVEILGSMDDLEKHCWHNLFGWDLELGKFKCTFKQEVKDFFKNSGKNVEVLETQLFHIIGNHWQERTGKSMLVQINPLKASIKMCKYKIQS